MKLKAVSKVKPVVTPPAIVEEETPDTFEAMVTPTRKTSISFDDLFLKAEDIESKCEDYQSMGVKDVTYEDEEFILNYTLNEQFVRSTPLSDYALGQLSTKLGVPVNYIRKCAKQGELELAVNNLNTWIPKSNTNYFVREYENKVRALLSQKYSTYDTKDILSSAQPYLEDFNIVGYFLSEERLHLRCTSNETLVVPGEVLKTGIQIDSSDVGRSTLIISFFLYRQVCTNGLTVAHGSGKLFSQKHIGITAEGIEAGLESALKSLPQVSEEIVKYIEGAQKKTSYTSFAKSIKQGDIADVIKNFQSIAKVSEGEAKKVIELIKSNKYNTTDWGVVNALTEVAQSYTLERRLELEKIAGKLLLTA